MVRSLALLGLATQLWACATTQAEVVSRSLVSQRTEQRRCDPKVTVAEVEPGWAATTLSLYTVERCDDYAIDRYETVHAPPTSDTARTIASVIGSVGATAIFAGVVFATGADQPPRDGRGIGPLETMAAVGAEIGTSAIGAIAGQGLLRLYEKVKQHKTYDEERTPLDSVERNHVPIDGLLEAGGRRFATHKSRVELLPAQLLELDPLTLRLGGAPLQFDARKLAIAQACARSFAAGPPVHLGQLAQAALSAALSDARECFEGGVAGAEQLYSKLLLEQMRRRMNAADGAHAAR